MRAEVISIGDEMTTGQRLDTNSQWLSQRLGDIGVHVLYHTTVGDELEANVQVFRRALERADIVISTGGLGPTADDLTRQALAETLGVELVLDQSALEHVRSLFARRKREMPPRNVVQAMFPRGSRVVPNPHGTAPGIAVAVPRPGRAPCQLFALPGVPAEMREMWQGSLEAELLALQGDSRRYIRHRSIRCFGVGESDLEQMLPDLIRRGRSPTVGITVNQATITLRIVADGDSPEACYAAMEPTVTTIRECLGDLIFGEGEDELQHAVVRKLAPRQQTLATVEIGSGGILASWLSEADHSGATYRGGLVLRGAAEKMLADGSPETDLIVRLADNCREQFQTTYALALGPFPSREFPAPSPGAVHFAVAGPAGTESKSSLFTGHPDILTARTVKSALDFMRLSLPN